MFCRFVLLQYMFFGHLLFSFPFSFHYLDIHQLCLCFMFRGSPISDIILTPRLHKVIIGLLLWYKTEGTVFRDAQIPDTSTSIRHLSDKVLM